MKEEGKYIVELEDGIDVSQLAAGTRVAVRMHSYKLHKILPKKVTSLIFIQLIFLN